MVWFCTFNVICIFSGRFSSTAKGPDASEPKEIVPSTRSDLIARILARPPLATNTFARICVTVCADREDAKKERTKGAQMSAESLMLRGGKLNSTDFLFTGGLSPRALCAAQSILW